MRTRSELNSKWWYRLLMFSFLGLALLSAVIAIVLVASDNKPRPVSDYKIDCVADYTNHRSFFAGKDANIYVYPYSNQTVYAALDESDKMKIRDFCDISKEEADKSTNAALSYIDEQTKLGTDNATIQREIDRSYRPYVIYKTERTQGSYLAILGYSLLSLLIIAVVIELGRRIFYYILLGSFRPEK